MASARNVDFFEISATRSVLDEIDDDLEPRQMAAFRRNVHRLEMYGWDLDGSYFGKVQGIKGKETLYEYRLTLDKVEYRVLFAEEGSTLVMLAGYKEKRNSVPAGKIRSAVARLKQWRSKTHQPPSQ